ncbi:beta-1,3-galactosyltransferase 1 [Lepeophtheirus salmonis]|uniref:beta-1,3-galactosyltransferase 1 n=1 Tax=Lepeophtheirus salmonis TaxID=72036 RepID=UPI001AEAE53B|nr:beta-1,3-galactosyltransferase 1-like [Lepeophtheirus salmonis]
MSFNKISTRLGIIFVLCLYTFFSYYLQIFYITENLPSFIKTNSNERDIWHQYKDSICRKDVITNKRTRRFNIEFTNASSYYGPTIPGWPPSASRDISKYISKESESYLVYPKSLDVKQTDFLIVIHSRLESFDTRKVIRDTWGKVLKKLSNNSSYIFVIGREESLSNGNRKILDTEITDHGDILQEDFIDSYYNLTLKSIISLKFLTRTVIWTKKPRRFLKIDDDVFLNIPLLLKSVFSPALWCKEPYLGGVILGNFTPNALSPTARVLGKWGVPSYMLERKQYPAFLSGSTYLFSFATGNCLFEEAFNLPYFHLEDIFITSFAATKCNINLDRIKGILFWRTKKEHILLTKKFAIHYTKKDEMKRLHLKILKYYKLKVS